MDILNCINNCILCCVALLHVKIKILKPTLKLLYIIDYLLPNFGKSVLMSHLTTQIFMTKFRRRDIQTTLQWLQFVVQTLNYQKLCEIF